MSRLPNVTLAVGAGLALVACSASDAPSRDAPLTEEETAAREQMLVENAVRDAYEAEGAEVTEITMELAPDGSRYTGRAIVRDAESGAELTVDCRYYTDVTGAPQLSCDRVNNPE
ncbi:hypothetical protein [Parasphingopyxis lamellibrachiae]|uniref:YpeB-like protein with protease inhibitory function n=1 Tax=Parasphingopyxis lamellibrachiae TaxID=680125 RepID=A0A3D9FEF4_9SPHN|nr:hypothetical protein [Parasphingopyxis lamellibrachiae]RED16200.1 hypothetical protein DFR46_1217 [Parasphingopyxis lamellibrachiae]